MKPDPRKEQKAVDDWNAAHDVGARVIVRKDDGTFVHTTTRSPAQVLSGHTAVVWLDGIAGCYCLDRVTAIDISGSADPDNYSNMEAIQLQTLTPEQQRKDHYQMLLYLYEEAKKLHDLYNGKDPSSSDVDEDAAYWAWQDFTDALNFAKKAMPAEEIIFNTQRRVEMSQENQTLRRNDVLRQTPAERAITDAMHAVESIGAHPLLTEAITLLTEARNKVADFVDDYGTE